MAVDELAEILNTMRVENQNNNENFEKVLASINSKLEMISEDTEAEDLLKLYITELKNVVELNHNDAVREFGSVQNVLNTVLASNEELVKSSDMDKFRSLILESFNVYALSLSEQKEKLEQLQIKFKEDLDGFDISRQENYADLKEELAVVLLNLKSIIEHNPSKPLDELANISGKISENLNIFKNEFKQTVEKDLENTSKIVSGISDVSDKISSVENSLRENSQNNLNSIHALLESVSDRLAADIQKNKEVSVQNSLDSSELVNQAQNALSSRMSDVENSLKNDSQNNLEDLKSLLNSISEKLSSEIQRHKELNAQQAMDDENHLNQTRNELSEQLTNINTLVSADVLNVLYSLKDLVVSVSKEDVSTIEKHFEKLEDEYLTIVTVEDFARFKTDFADFLQKILDNANVLNVNSDTIKEQICSILDRIETLNCSDRLENIADRITDIKSSFEDNSRMNYENIINQINYLKDELNTKISNQDETNSGKFETLNLILSDLCSNVTFLRDFSTQKSTDILEEVKSTLNLLSGEIQENVNNNTRVNVDAVKESLSNIFAKLNNIKEDFDQRNDANIFSISSGFENVKSSFENVFSAFEHLNNTFGEVAGKNYGNLSSNIADISCRVDELKLVITGIATDYNEKLFLAVKEIAEKLDSFTDIAGVNSDIAELRDAVISLSSDLKTVQDVYANQIKDINEIHTVELKNVSEKFNDFELSVKDAIENLKNYIAEANSAGIEPELAEKLQDLSVIIEQNASEYGLKMETLQDKLVEFAQIVENSAADTEGKIASSLEEISDVKEQLSSLGDLMKSVHNSSDEKFSEVLCRLEASIENIIHNIEASNSMLAGGFNTVFKENLIVVEDKLGGLLNVLDDVKAAIPEKEVLNNVEEKVAQLKDQFGLINTDISNALQYKTEEILKSFENVKESINTLTTSGLDNVVYELKLQLDQSFMNLENNVDGKLSENSELLNRIEQVYKETYNKMNSIEECLTERVQNSLELLNASLQSCSIDIKNNFENKIAEYTEDLRAKTSNELSVLKNEISKELASLAALQLSRNDVAEEITQIGGKIKQYINAAGNIIVEKCDSNNNKALIESLNAKVDVLINSSDKDEILDSINEASENSENGLNVLKSALEKSQDGLEILKTDFQTSQAKLNGLKDVVETINSKLDVLAMSSNEDEYFARFDELSETADRAFEALLLLQQKSDSLNISAEKIVNSISDSQNEVSDSLSALHAKVDVLASDNSDSDLFEEIDDLKDLIFEQRKYFEAVSDEKSEAIDKYLRDVLVKLENTDVDKVVEEKTEEINQNILEVRSQLMEMAGPNEEMGQKILEVQNQLKQLASSNDDDFEYTYTLQDVESDIARLRIAINNISGEEISNFSDDIKRIINSVEELENTLTQDQTAELKSDIERLNEDIVSISTRTNKLLLTSDESYKALNEGLDNFNNIINRLEDRINYLDNKEITERIENKVNDIHSMALENVNTNKVFHKVMMYLGEWIDSTTENLSEVTQKTAEIPQINEKLDNVSDIINGLREAIPDNSELVESIERKFMEQEARIDNLENKLERILSTLEEKDDIVLNRKVDKLENMISSLGANIEKLASYVDEE